jgi:hypothetical protein
VDVRTVDVGVADGCGVRDGDGEALRVGVGVDDGAGVGVGLAVGFGDGVGAGDGAGVAVGSGEGVADRERCQFLWCSYASAHGSRAMNRTPSATTAITRFTPRRNPNGHDRFTVFPPPTLIAGLARRFHEMNICSRRGDACDRRWSPPTDSVAQKRDVRIDMAGNGHVRMWICARLRCLRTVAEARHRELQGAAEEIGGLRGFCRWVEGGKDHETV